MAMLATTADIDIRMTSVTSRNEKIIEWQFEATKEEEKSKIVSQTKQKKEEK